MKSTFSRTQILISALLMSGLGGCNFSLYQARQKNTGGPEVMFEKVLGGDQVPSFEFIRSQILEPNSCTQCHAWANSYTLTKIYTIPGNSDGSPLIKRLKNMGGDMPQNKAALNNQAFQVLKLWIDYGSQETNRQKPKPSPTTTTTTLSENPTFADVSKYVFETNCSSCHRAGATSGGRKFPFQNYRDVLSQEDSITGEPVLTPGDLGNSKMWTDIIDRDMPPPKAIANGTATALSAEQIDLVKRWIEQGAIEK
ncbi:MAG: hypothetical protein COT73_11805 [Bdellovibrio sp. CG10_big_fil_rev_8_21_14_0_10_47_8]|nr:MAG: hypothetical protein COT73_11805 [Bdellovibrio sp. CG10_big_fil_rev_8_21_14_0_10_47_8]